MLFLNKIIVGSQPQVSTAFKKEFSICLPFLGKETLIVKNKLTKLFASQFPAFKLRIVLKPGIKIGSFFNLKTLSLFVFGRTLFKTFRAVIAILPTSGKLHGTFW